MIRAEKRLVAAIGVEDLCVIETADAVLISKSDQTQRVREVVDELQHRGATEHVFHAKVNRPWGSYTVLEEDQDGFKIKRIEVAPGARLSLQSHRNVPSTGSSFPARPQSPTVKKCSPCTRTRAPTFRSAPSIDWKISGSEPLHIVEIQVGEYLGEDDIQRFEDNYGR